MTTFQELGLSEAVAQAVSQMGFEEPTPIQAMTIPLVMQGRDVIGRAQTGTGKTAAFGIPLAEQCNPEQETIQGLVVTPTRELAMQVAEELNRIGQYKHVRSLPLYGGQEISRQIKALKQRPAIIVGTPGRLLDHIRRRTIRLDQLQIVVLDEADEMLNMGFIEDIEAILAKTPTTRQNMLFSATMPSNIQNLAREFMRNPEIVQTNPREVTVQNITQEYIEVNENQKMDVLCRLLDVQSPEAAIVFARTKRRVDEVSEALSSRGYSAEGIHGDMTQSNRDMVMHKFKSGMIEVLVATDVASRGLDITGVTHVFNLDIPQDAESYVHRIGRTGRAGEKGRAMTLVTPRELRHLKYIQEHTRHEVIRRPIPSVDDVKMGLRKAAIDNLLSAASIEDIEAYRSLAESLLEEHDSVTLLAAALKVMTREPNQTPLQDLTLAPPIVVKGNYNERSKRTPSKGRTNQFGNANKPRRPKMRNR